MSLCLSLCVSKKLQPNLQKDNEKYISLWNQLSLHNLLWKWKPSETDRQIQLHNQISQIFFSDFSFIWFLCFFRLLSSSLILQIPQKNWKFKFTVRTFHNNIINEIVRYSKIVFFIIKNFQFVKFLIFSSSLEMDGKIQLHNHISQMFFSFLDDLF